MTLPGNLSKEKMLERMIRVDQAGEYGAKRIYAGQLAVLKNTPSAPIIEEMAAQEQVHLDYFNQQTAARRVRPTIMQPLWHVGGWLLGAATAAMGEKAAMACTVAVESVIDEHYQSQKAWLSEHHAEPELQSKIEQFRAEEMEHHATALEHEAEQATAYPLLTSIIRKKTKFAIWLSERI